MTADGIEALGLRKEYVPSSRWMRLVVRTAIREPVLALDSVDCSVAPGSVCAVVGPNGAGKTTLFRILTGLTTNSGGSAAVCGLDVSLRDPTVRRLIGYMPADERTLFLRQTCAENLEFHGRLHGFKGTNLIKAVAESLESVGLSHARTRAAFSLSSGMRARLQLARALLHRPRVLILDEPTSAVDPLSAVDFVWLLARLASERSMAVLLSSHRLDEVELLSGQDVLVLDRGRVAYLGPLKELQSRATLRSYRLAFADRASALHAADAIGGSGLGIEDEDGRVLIVRDDVPLGEVLKRLDGLLPMLQSVEEPRPSLRDLLTQLRSAIRP